MTTWSEMTAPPSDAGVDALLKKALEDVQNRKVALNAAVDELERVAREDLAS